MKYYGLYKITNLANGKMYIGKHVTSNLDDGYIGSGKILKQAIKKYGVENFRKEWLGFYEDLEELNYMERVFVDQTWVDRADTYNLKLGGEGGCLHGWLKGKKLPASTKNKISRALTGKKRSDKACLSNSKAKKGIPLSKKHKANLSKANTGCHFWNNGLICVYRKECPEGFKSGMLNRRKNA